MLEDDLLLGQAENTSDVTEEPLDATRRIVTAVSHDVPISKKRYLELVRALSNEVQNMQRESDATTPHFSEEEVKIGELALKVCLLSDDSVAVSNLKRPLAARDLCSALMEESSAIVNKSLASITWRHGTLHMQLNSGRGTLSRVERVTRDITDMV